MKSSRFARLHIQVKYTWISWKTRPWTYMYSFRSLAENDIFEQGLRLRQKNHDVHWFQLPHRRYTNCANNEQKDVQEWTDHLLVLEEKPSRWSIFCWKTSTECQIKSSKFSATHLKLSNSGLITENYLKLTKNLFKATRYLLQKSNG